LEKAGKNRLLINQHELTLAEVNHQPFPGGEAGMVFLLTAKNAADSFVEGGNDPLRIVATVSARFKSSSEAAFSIPVFL